MAEGIVVNNRYKILPHLPLPEYDSPSAKAYAVEDSRLQSIPHFALICEVWPLPRIDEINHFKTFQYNSMSLYPVFHAPIPWGGPGKHSLVLIFPAPQGERLMLVGTNTLTVKINENDIASLIVAPLIPFLRSLQGLELAHRAIRPDNIFFRDKSHNSIILGENFSAPAGFNQPILFESLERAMASPQCRGSGSHSDDLYALGITILILALGHNPWASLSPEEILKNRLQEGTLRFIIPKLNTLTPRVADLIRGLVKDNLSERWGIDQLEDWSKNLSFKVKPNASLKRSLHPFLIQGEPCFNPRTLAFSLSKNWPEAIKTLTKEEGILSWIKGNMQDPASVEKIYKLVKTLKTTPAGKANEQNRLVSQICILLDPLGPIRWEKVSVMPDGIPILLATCFFEETSNNIVGAMLHSRILSFWISVQESIPLRLIRFYNLYESLHIAPTEVLLGSGIEKALYKLNPGLPCLSPLVVDKYIYNGAELLPALDQILVKNSKITHILDPHIIGFISSRLESIRISDLRNLLHPNHSETALAQLRILRDVQAYYKTGPLPALTQWIINNRGPIIKNYHSRKIQQKVEKDVLEVASQGNLHILMYTFTNPIYQYQDKIGFSAAQHDYAQLDNKIAIVKKNYIQDPKKLWLLSHALTYKIMNLVGLSGILATVLYLISGLKMPRF